MEQSSTVQVNISFQAAVKLEDAPHLRGLFAGALGVKAGAVLLSSFDAEKKNLQICILRSDAEKTVQALREVCFKHAKLQFLKAMKQRENKDPL